MVATHVRTSVTEKTTIPTRTRTTRVRKRAKPKPKGPARPKAARVRRNPNRTGRKNVGNSNPRATVKSGVRARAPRRKERGEKNLEQIMNTGGEPSPIFTPVRKITLPTSFGTFNDICTYVVADMLMRSDNPNYITRALGGIVSHPSFKYHLMRYCLAHWVNVGALGSQGAPVAWQFNPPSETGAVPVALAKILEYCGPYKDPTCGTESQILIELPSDPLQISRSSLLNGLTDEDMAKEPPDFHMRFEPRDTGASDEVNWMVDASPIDLAEVDENFYLFDNLIRESGVKFVEFKKIPQVAPDASATANIITISNGGRYCGNDLPEFDPEITVLLHSTSATPANFTNAYLKPLPVFGLGTTSTVTGKYEYVATGVTVMNQCTWVKGKLKKLLRRHPASGVKGRRLKSLYPTIRRINWGQISRLVHTVIAQIMTNKLDTNDMNPNIFPDLSNDKLLDMYYTLLWYFQAPIITRIINVSGTAHFVTGNLGAEMYYYVGKIWEAVPLPTPILDVISQIGPTVIDGRLILPVGTFGATSSNVLVAGIPYGDMSHNRNLGSSSVANSNHMGNCAASAAIAVSREYVVNGRSITRSALGYDNVTTFPSVVPRRWASLFKRAISQFKLADQFLSEKLPLLGGNTMLMTVVTGAEVGEVSQDIEFGTTGSLAYLVNINEYYMGVQINAAMPLSREDVGRCVAYCPFSTGAGDNWSKFTGATQLDVLFDHFDALSQLVEEVMTDESSIFNRALAADISKNKNNTLYAYRAAMGPIFANLYPENLFVSDTPANNWKKLKCNLSISAAPYNGLPYFDPTKHGSPPIYQHLKKFLTGGPEKIKEGYLRLKKFIGHDLPGEVNDFTNAWVQLANEAATGVKAAGAVSAALA